MAGGFGESEGVLAEGAGFVWKNGDGELKIVAVWIPICGENKIEREKSYQAKLDKGIWTVEGSLPKGKDGEMVLGGVAVAEIAKDDGCILRVSHEK